MNNPVLSSEEIGSEYNPTADEFIDDLRTILIDGDGLSPEKLIDDLKWMIERYLEKRRKVSKDDKEDIKRLVE